MGDGDGYMARVVREWVVMLVLHCHRGYVEIMGVGVHVLPLWVRFREGGVRASMHAWYL